MRNISTRAAESSSVITAENAITMQFGEFLASANEASKDECVEMRKTLLIPKIKWKKNLFTLRQLGRVAVMSDSFGYDSKRVSGLIDIPDE